MKLIDLIAYFRTGGVFGDFCKAQGLNEKSEVIEIYAQEPTCLEAELGFFPIEETEGRIKFEKNGQTYQNLFDFFYFMDVIEDSSGRDGLSDSELAYKLFSYAMKDA